MKVHVIRRPEALAIDIYIELERRPDGSTLCKAGDLEILEVAPGEEMPRYVRLFNEVAEAIVTELMPPPVATDRHLRDAIGVRDRLLTLVEKQNSPT